MYDANMTDSPRRLVRAWQATCSTYKHSALRATAQLHHLTGQEVGLAPALFLSLSLRLLCTLCVELLHCRAFV